MKVYNTLSGRKEEFLPQGDEVKMYVCGVTPYADCHIGHAMSYIIFDVIRRYLVFSKYNVKYVQNITDIDDRIIDRANQLGITTDELARKFTARYFEDMDALNIGRADIYPKATEEIPKIIEVIQGLVDKGYAYPAGGSVYFRVRNVPDYGKLSHRSLESMMNAEGALGGDDKESPMDFVLWKAAKPGEPSWESPWGPGRPGWHIECSVMSLKYLGNTLDIHGGGQDLVFPHHENEIAQSESFTGVKPFARYWLHNGLVQLGAEKMSKSLGNLITIKEALERYSPDAIRIFALNSHYRSPLTYSEEALGAAERGVDRLRQATDEKLAEQYTKVDTGEIVWALIPSGNLKEIKEKFIRDMDDDFGTPRALSWLFILASEIDKAVSLGRNSEVVEHRELLKELAGVLGLTLEPPPSLDAEPFIELQKSTIARVRKAKLDKLIDAVGLTLENQDIEPEDVAPYINWLRDIRNALRKEKQFQLADEIRDKLDKLGIVLEDTPQGTVWRRKR